MGFVHTFRQNFEISVAGSPGSYPAAATTGDWVQLAGEGREAVLIAICGELDADMTITVNEATDSSGTGSQAISGLSGTFTNGSDEGTAGIITVRSDDLTDGYDYVAAVCTAGAADAWAGVWVVGQLHDYPASNSALTFNDYN